MLRSSFHYMFRSLFLYGSIIICVCFSACERKIDTIRKDEVLLLPSITSKNSTTVFTDSGKVQLIMSFDIMESYTNIEEPYSEFRSGIRVSFFEGKDTPAGTVYSKYAKYIDKKKLWELKDSVVVVNESNDKLETEQLFWDQEKDMIYTDRFIKITNEDQTVMGTGFESDHRLTRRKIRNVTATIYLKEEK